MLLILSTTAFASAETVNITEEIDCSSTIFSKAMSYEEAVLDMAVRKGISFDEARELVPSSRDVRSVIYNSYQVTINADKSIIDRYRPTVEFWCQLSGINGSWRIDKIYDINMIREYKGKSKWFVGETKGHVQNNGGRIQYFVNGDFFNHGNTETTNGFSIGDYGFQLNFSVTASNNLYKYVYTNGFISKTGVIS